MNNTSNTTSLPQRIPELDGLRGVAILMVISFHYINNTLVDSPGRIQKLLSGITSFGWAGVDLFFLLSGFLIGSILIRYKNSNNYFRTFYFRRFVRIVPNYYLLIAIFIVINLIPYFRGNKFLTGDQIIPVWSYFAMLHNLYMAKFASLGNGAMSVTWSIGIEEQFYILFPLVIFFIKKKYIPVVLITAIVVAIFARTLFTNWIPPYVLLPCRMDAISFGALIAYYNSENKLKDWIIKYNRHILLLFAIFLALVAFIFILYKDFGVFRNTILSLIFSIALIYALHKNENFFGNILRMRWLLWIGRISYSLYLFHYLILGIFSHFAGNRAGVGVYSMHDAWYAVMAFAFSLLFSWIVYNYLEQPMVKLGKIFTFDNDRPLKMKSASI